TWLSSCWNPVELRTASSGADLFSKDSAMRCHPFHQGFTVLHVSSAAGSAVVVVSRPDADCADLSWRLLPYNAVAKTASRTASPTVDEIAAPIAPRKASAASSPNLSGMS